jgi:hypothetical protein
MLNLPEIKDLERILNNNVANQPIIRKEKESIRKDIKHIILNTPLYRLYAETNKFETLNMIKPIHLTQRRLVELKEYYVLI